MPSRPWDSSLSHDAWRHIGPRSFSNDELLADIAGVPRLIRGAPAQLPAAH